MGRVRRAAAWAASPVSARSGVARRLRALVAVVALAGLLAPVSSPRLVSAQAVPADQQLAERYAPVAYLRSQKGACDKDGEGYFPAPVEVVLGNPEVALKRRVEGNGSAADPIVMMAPAASDLAGLGGDFYLDFPGNPRRAGCRYETDFKRFAAERGAVPTTYARIVVDAGAERLVLQYWFWYYFNDWNNTHESDWEMIQLVFDATSAEEALTRAPDHIGYAQHGGGETSDWEDGTVRVEDGRPAVFPAAGSHGTYFGQRRYIGWGDNGTGFGCDDTTTPSIRTPLNVVLIPERPAPDGPLAWVSFEGRWGERQEWEFNGPTGPNLGKKWDDPLGAEENWRTFTLYVPSSNAPGPSASGLFCAASARGSAVFIAFGTEPRLLVAAALTLLGSLVALFVVCRRQLAAAIGVYRRHLRTFLIIGACAIPLGILFNGFALLFARVPPTNWLLHWLNDTGGARLAAAATVGGLQQAGMIVVIAPPVIQAMRAISAGETPEVRACFRDGYRKVGPILLGLAIVYVTAGLLVVFVAGIPLAIWLSVRWQFFAQAVVLDGARSGPGAVRQSGVAVRGDWWPAFGQALVFQAIALLPGPLIGVALLLFGKTSVQFANSLSSVFYAVTVPISLIGLTLAYERFRNPRPAAVADDAPSPA